MDGSTIIICIIMTFLILWYAIKYGGYIHRYFVLLKKGELNFVDGTVTERVNKRLYKTKNQRCTISVPRITYKLDNEKKQIDSLLYYPDVVIGKNVEVAFYRNKKGGIQAWIKRDMEKAKVDFFKKLFLLISLTILMIVFSVISGNCVF